MFNSSSEPPICAGLTNTTRENDDEGERQSMISRRNGVREVRQRPGSPAETRDSTRYRSAHSAMLRSGSGRSAAEIAARRERTSAVAASKGEDCIGRRLQLP